MDESNAPSAMPSSPRSTSSTPTGMPSPDEAIDVSAFKDFYRQFMATLVAFLMWQGARLPEATEVAQDTMTEAYKNWTRIRNPKAWARRVASRMLIRRIASAEKIDFVDKIPEQNCLLRPLTNVEEWEQRHDILRILNDLPPRQRQVLAWTVDGYTPSEIADELKITPEAVRTSLKEARRRIANQGTTGDKR